MDAHPEPIQQLAQRRMLSAREVEIDRVQEAVRRIVESPPKRRAGRAEHDLAQWRGH
jgi:hypothetical protein